MHLCSSSPVRYGCSLFILASNYRETGDPHYGVKAWPALNSAIITVVKDEQVDGFLDFLKKLDEKTPALGLRAFVWNVEKMI